MGKEIYLAGKIDSKEASLAAFSTELEGRGHTVHEKWWEKGRLPKPYMDYSESSAPAATAMINAAYQSDVTILFPGDSILGAAVEFGAALGSTKVNPNKEIIVVDPFEGRQSVFYAHPAVTAVRGIAQVRKMDWY